ncbi:hypothetical protein KSE_38310 [Kitasatospora setae KM-6054]|uniref:Lipoprotein n=1 Tax=Kitasatospora setae (strain ATCC 33774 / DSM 43861 / JCM 3304 / KCC A-0304 / NBRC 14216 / KM-6054) TaxID=452652 RepID=E4MZ53_KITSK|nr:hypothetical protein KSE_38310 [Kitasatospora setae KM-6054]
MAVAAAAAGLLLAGCTSSAGGTPGGRGLPSPSIAAAPAAPADARTGLTGLPLAAYGSGDELVQQRFQALQLLIGRCMREAGYSSYTPADSFEAPSGGGAGGAVAGAFGYLGADAATAGFRSPRPAASAAGPAPRRQVPADERSASDDCTRRSLGRISSAAPKSSDLYQRLYGESLQVTALDGRVVAATAAWRECMGRVGVPAEDPQALARTYQGAGAEVSAQERTAAEADARCTAETGLAGTWFAVLAGYQREQVERHADELEPLRQSLAEQARQYARILANGGS